MFRMISEGMRTLAALFERTVHDDMPRDVFGCDCSWCVAARSARSVTASDVVDKALNEAAASYDGTPVFRPDPPSPDPELIGIRDGVTAEPARNFAEEHRAAMARWGWPAAAMPEPGGATPCTCDDCVDRRISLRSHAEVAAMLAEGKRRRSPPAPDLAAVQWGVDHAEVKPEEPSRRASPFPPPPGGYAAAFKDPPAFIPLRPGMRVMPAPPAEAGKLVAMQAWGRTLFVGFENGLYRLDGDDGDSPAWVKVMP